VKRSVGVASMFDAKDDHFSHIPSDPVEQAVGTAAGRPTPFAQPEPDTGDCHRRTGAILVPFRRAPW